MISPQPKWSSPAPFPEESMFCDQRVACFKRFIRVAQKQIRSFGRDKARNIFRRDMVSALICMSYCPLYSMILIA